MEFAISMLSFSGVALALSAVMVSYMYMSRGKFSQLRVKCEAYFKAMSKVSILMTCCIDEFECMLRFWHELPLFDCVA